VFYFLFFFFLLLVSSIAGSTFSLYVRELISSYRGLVLSFERLPVVHYLPTYLSLLLVSVRQGGWNKRLKP